MFKYLGDYEKNKIKYSLKDLLTIKKILNNIESFMEINKYIDLLKKDPIIPGEFKLNDPLFYLIEDYLEIRLIFRINGLNIENEDLINLYHINDTLRSMPYLANCEIPNSYFQFDEYTSDFLESLSGINIQQIPLSSLRVVPYEDEYLDETFQFYEEDTNLLEEILPEDIFENYFEYVNGEYFSPEYDETIIIYINYMDIVPDSVINDYGSVEHLQNVVESEVEAMLSESYRDTFAESYLSSDKNGIILAMSDYSFICNPYFRKDFLLLYGLLKGLTPKKLEE